MTNYSDPLFTDTGNPGSWAHTSRGGKARPIHKYCRNVRPELVNYLKNQVEHWHVTANPFSHRGLCDPGDLNNNIEQVVLNTKTTRETTIQFRKPIGRH